MKRALITLPAERNEQAIVEDIAGESERLGAAQQDAAKLEDHRAGMLATAGLDEIHALADSLTRVRLRMEIAQARLDALHGELRRFYQTEAQAALDAEMAPIPEIDAEERAAIRSYEEHAAAVAADLAKLVDLDGRRHRVSVAVHRLSGRWVPPDRPTYHGALAQQVKLPSAGDGPDFWPINPYGRMLDAAAGAGRDQAALAEYRGSE